MFVRRFLAIAVLSLMVACNKSSSGGTSEDDFIGVWQGHYEWGKPRDINLGQEEMAAATQLQIESEGKFTGTLIDTEIGGTWEIVDGNLVLRYERFLWKGKQADLPGPQTMTLDSKGRLSNLGQSPAPDGSEFWYERKSQ